MSKLSKRQKRYREYLKGEHWKVLRQAVIDRDGWKCVRCSDATALQVHHKVYRGNLEDTLLGDLETLCRECHRLEHGIGPRPFDLQYRKVKLLIETYDPATCSMPRVPADEWQKLWGLIEYPCQLEWASALIFLYAAYVQGRPRDICLRARLFIFHEAEKWEREGIVPPGWVREPDITSVPAEHAVV